MGDFRELISYRKSFSLAMDIYKISKRFPKHEVYSLADQIRRSSRSVCSNLAEAYRKRDYVRHFKSKISDSLMENSETTVWLEFALHCRYLSVQEYRELLSVNHEIDRLLFHMHNNPSRYGVSAK